MPGKNIKSWKCVFSNYNNDLHNKSYKVNSPPPQFFQKFSGQNKIIVHMSSKYAVASPAQELRKKTIRTKMKENE